MSYRLVAVSLLFATLIATEPAVAQRLDPRPGGSVYPSPFSDTSGEPASTGRITGTVRTLDGHPVSNARIDIHDVGRGNINVLAHSDSSGSFEMYNIVPGTYEVTASNGVDETRERVQVGSMSLEPTVDLRLRGNGTSGPSIPGKGTVSFSQYAVPNKARALYEKAVEAMRHNKTDEASKKLEAALAVFPKFAEALTLRGALKGDEGKVEEALADFQHAIECDASYAAGYLAMAALLNSHGRFKESEPALTQAVRLAPNLWQTHFEISRSKLGNGQFAEALRSIDRATELQGGPQKQSPELHLLRGYALAGLTDFPRAAQEIEAFLKQEPTGPLAQHARSVLNRLQTSTITASK